MESREAPRTSSITLSSRITKDLEDESLDGYHLRGGHLQEVWDVDHCRADPHPGRYGVCVQELQNFSGTHKEAKQEECIVSGSNDLYNSFCRSASTCFPISSSSILKGVPNQTKEATQRTNCYSLALVAAQSVEGDTAR